MKMEIEASEIPPAASKSLSTAPANDEIPSSVDAGITEVQKSSDGLEDAHKGVVLIAERAGLSSYDEEPGSDSNKSIELSRSKSEKTMPTRNQTPTKLANTTIAPTANVQESVTLESKDQSNKRKRQSSADEAHLEKDESTTKVESNDALSTKSDEDVKGEEVEKIENNDAIRDRPVRKRKQKQRVEEAIDIDIPRRQSTGSRRASSGRGRGGGRGGAGRGVALSSTPTSPTAPVVTQPDFNASSRGVPSPPRLSGGINSHSTVKSIHSHSVGSGATREKEHGNGRPTVVIAGLDPPQRKPERVELTEVFSDLTDIRAAYQTMAGIRELQRQASNGLLEASFSRPSGPAGDVGSLPDPAEISDTLRLVEGSRDILWNALVEIRRKQILLDSVVAARAEEAAAVENPQGDEKMRHTTLAGGTEALAQSQTAPSKADTNAKTKTKTKTKTKVTIDSSHEVLNDTTDGLNEVDKQVLRSRLRDVYAIQIQNSLKISESSIFSTIIGGQGIARNRTPSSKDTIETPSNVLQRVSSSSSVASLNRGSGTAANSPTSDRGSTPLPGLREMLHSEQIQRTAGVFDVSDHSSLPSNLESFLIPPEDFEKKRPLIALAIRDKKLKVQRAWYQIADNYFDIKHQWDAHISEIEAEEEEKEQNGPRLRGEFSRPKT